MRGGFIGITFFLLAFFSSPVWSQESAEEGGSAILKESAMRSIAAPPVFKYNATGQRDPFASFVRPHQEVDAKNVPPLLRVSVDVIKLVGIAWGSTGYGAMVQTPDGKSYPVKKGMRIGANQGRIKDIGQKEIVVEEPYLNIFGRSDLKQIVMKLYNKKEGVE